MLRTVLLSVVLLFCQGCLLSQTILYPIRQNHKWGFISRSARMILQPKYDIFTESPLPWNNGGISTMPSPFRLIEQDDKVGLLDYSLREVLPCQYNRVRPLTLNCFLVEKDSLFNVVNRKGEDLFPEKYEDVRTIDSFFFKEPRFFLAKKNGKWGAINRNGKVVLPLQYYDIEPAGDNGYFRVAGKNGIWGLVDSLNRPLLKGKEYLMVQVFSPNFIAVSNSSPTDKTPIWNIVDSRGNAIFEDETKEPMMFAEVNLLNATWVTAKPYAADQSHLLWNLKTSKRCDPSKKHFGYYPYDERYVQCNKYRSLGLIDTAGNYFLKPEFDSILPSGVEGIFRLKKNKLWALAHPVDTTPFAFVYYRLEPFEDSIALCMDEILGWGAVNARFQEVVPRTFKKIVRDDDQLKAFDKNNKLKIFKLNNNTEASLEQSFDNEVLTLKIGTNNSQYYKEATVMIDSKRTKRMFFDQTNHMNVLVNIDSTAEWIRDFKLKKWGFRPFPKGEGQEIIPYAYGDVIEVDSGRMVAVYTRKQVISNAFCSNVFNNSTRLSSAALHQMKGAAFISPFRFLGIRTMDFNNNNPYAAFVDTSGQMGLISRNGTVKKKADGSELRFTYIGYFFEGLAPVCVGGALKAGIDYEYDRYRIGPLAEFVRNFNLKEPKDEPTRYTTEQFIYLDTTAQNKGRWGYIDQEGNFFIEPKYDLAYEFQGDSFALVKKNDLLGMVKSDGKEILPTKYRSIERFFGRFMLSIKNPNIFFFNQKGAQICDPIYDKYAGFTSSGLCAVQRNKLWGFINEQGEAVIACQYDSIQAFSEGLAAVRDSGDWVFINAQGQRKFNATAAAGGPVATGKFKDGLCRFRLGRNWGYFDTSGTVKIKPMFSLASDFRQYVAVVKEKKYAGIIDTSGKYFLPPTKYEEITPYNNYGVCNARINENGLWGLLDTAGKLLTPLKYNKIEDFVDGFSIVRAGGYCGLLNAQGKEVIPPTFLQMKPLSDGAVAVQTPMKKDWTYYNTKGQRMMAKGFPQAESFFNGLALVNGTTLINRWGENVPIPANSKLLFFSEGIVGLQNASGKFFADPAGNNIFNISFADIQAFGNGIAKIRQKKWGAINRRGCFIVPTKYNFVHLQKDGNIIVRPPLLYGIADRYGKIIMEPTYDRIELVTGQIYRIEVGEKIGYLKFDGTELWKLSN